MLLISDVAIHCCYSYCFRYEALLKLIMTTVTVVVAMLVQLGVSALRFASHSLRKGARTHSAKGLALIVVRGCVGVGVEIPILLRGGWSLGQVKDCYQFVGDAGVCSLRPLRQRSFCVSL